MADPIESLASMQQARREAMKELGNLSEILLNKAGAVTTDVRELDRQAQSFITDRNDIELPPAPKSLLQNLKILELTYKILCHLTRLHQHLVYPMKLSQVLQQAPKSKEPGSLLKTDEKWGHADKHGNVSKCCLTMLNRLEGFEKGYQPAQEKGSRQGQGRWLPLEIIREKMRIEAGEIKKESDKIVEFINSRQKELGERIDYLNQNLQYDILVIMADFASEENGDARDLWLDKLNTQMRSIQSMAQFLIGSLGHLSRKQPQNNQPTEEHREIQPE